MTQTKSDLDAARTQQANAPRGSLSAAQESAESTDAELQEATSDLDAARNALPANCHIEQFIAAANAVADYNLLVREIAGEYQQVVLDAAEGGVVDDISGIRERLGELQARLTNEQGVGCRPGVISGASGVSSPVKRGAFI